MGGVLRRKERGRKKEDKRKERGRSIGRRNEKGRKRTEKEGKRKERGRSRRKEQEEEARADYGLGTIGTCLGPTPAGGPHLTKKKRNPHDSCEKKKRK